MCKFLSPQSILTFATLCWQPFTLLSSKISFVNVLLSTSLLFSLFKVIQHYLLSSFSWHSVCCFQVTESQSLLLISLLTTRSASQFSSGLNWTRWWLLGLRNRGFLEESLWLLFCHVIPSFYTFFFLVQYFGCWWQLSPTAKSIEDLLVVRGFGGFSAWLLHTHRLFIMSGGVCALCFTGYFWLPYICKLPWASADWGISFMQWQLTTAAYFQSVFLISGINPSVPCSGSGPSRAFLTQVMC